MAEQRARNTRWTRRVLRASKKTVMPRLFKPVDLAIPLFHCKSHVGIDGTYALHSGLGCARGESA